MNEQEVRIMALSVALQIKESQANGGYTTNEVLEIAGEIERYIAMGREY